MRLEKKRLLEMNPDDRERHLIEELVHRRGIEFLVRWLDVESREIVAMYDVSEYSRDRTVKQLDDFCFFVYCGSARYRQVKWFGENGRVMLRTVMRL